MKSDESRNKYIQKFINLLINKYVLAKIFDDQEVVFKNKCFHMDYY